MPSDRQFTRPAINPTDMMKRLKEFIANAEACRAMAAKVSNPTHKAELLELAAKWAAMADERERLLKTQKRLMELR